MGSIPNLTQPIQVPQIQPPQQQPVNFLDQLGRLADLRGSLLRTQVLQQQAAIQQQMAPAQISQARSQAQLSQIAVQDQQKSTQAMLDSNGDMNAYLQNLRSAGVSGDFIFKAQNAALDMQLKQQTKSTNQLTGEKDLTAQIFPVLDAAKKQIATDPAAAQQLLQQARDMATTGQFALTSPDALAQLPTTAQGIELWEDRLKMHDMAVDQGIKDSTATNLALQSQEGQSNYKRFFDTQADRTRAGLPTQGYVEWEASAEAKARLPVEKELANYRAQLDLGVANVNQTEGFIANTIYAPTITKLQKISDARTALLSALQNKNMAAAKTAATDLAGAGSEFTKIAGTLGGFFVGDTIMQSMGHDALAYLDDQAKDTVADANKYAAQVRAIRNVPQHGKFAEPPSVIRPIWKVGDKTYQYNGTGDESDLNNYHDTSKLQGQSPKPQGQP